MAAIEGEASGDDCTICELCPSSPQGQDQFRDVFAELIEWMK